MAKGKLQKKLRLDVLKNDNSVSETLEIAKDVAKKLIESQQEKQKTLVLSQVENKFDYPLIIGA